MKRTTDVHLAELEAAVQLALSRLADLHQRYLLEPGPYVQAALKVASERWDSSKQALKRYKARYQAAGRPRRDWRQHRSRLPDMHRSPSTTKSAQR